jgi:fructan beta-fructosidase
MREPAFPDVPFNQQISFPCELTLHSTPNGLRVFREPIREIARLHNGQDTWTNRILQADQVLPLESSGQFCSTQRERPVGESSEWCRHHSNTHHLPAKLGLEGPAK